MKKLLSCLVLLTLFCISTLSVGVAILFTGYEIHRDVSYGASDSEVMDIYIPKEAYGKEANGCVLFIHGGSWSGGDKREEELRCRNVASNGYIAATMNYTLHNEDTQYTYTVEHVLDEIDMALERIKNFTAELGINTTRAATSGYSAGAHLSMLYSFSRGSSAPLEIKFTANMAGPADISPDIWGDDLSMRIGSLLSNTDITQETLKSGEADKILDNISPVTYIDANTPPSIFIYGGKDTTVPFGNAESIMQKFDTVWVQYDFILLPDANHMLIHNIPKRLSYPKLLISYCDKYFS